MIELKVEEYCHGCPDFNPEALTDNMYAGSSRADSFTICVCKYRKRCAAIARMIEKKIAVDPYVIDFNIFMGTNDYTKQDLIYYSMSGRMCYLNGNAELRNPELRIGNDIYETIKSQYSDGIVYVRNDMLKIDYKITVVLD